MYRRPPSLRKKSGEETSVNITGTRLTTVIHRRPLTFKGALIERRALIESLRYLCQGLVN